MDGSAEYVGGYSDWKRRADALVAGKADPSRKKRSGNSQQAEKATGTSNRRTGLSGKEKRELEALPGRIEALEERQLVLTEETSKADFYQQDPAHVKATLKSLADVTGELEQTYLRWAELEDAHSCAEPDDEMPQ